MGNLFRRVHAFGLRHRVGVCLVLAFLFLFPTLYGGFYLEDFWHQALLDAHARGLDRSGLLDFSQKLWSWEAERPGETGLGKLGEASPFARVWFAHPDARVRLFRPLTAWTLLANHRISGKDPFGYHAVNLGLWLLLVLAVLELHRRLIPRDPPALLLAGLFFVLDKDHLGNVAWIAARPGLLDVLLSVVSLLFYDRFRQHGGLHRLLLCLLTLALALCSGETAMATLVWLVAYEIFLAREPLRHRPITAILPALLIAGYALLYVALGYGARASGWYLSLVDRPRDYLATLLTQRLPGNLMGALTPIPADFSQAPSTAVILAGLALAGIVAAFLLPVVRRRPEMRFAAAAGLGTLPFLGTGPAFDSRLLFPSVAFSLLLAAGVTDALRRLRDATPPSRLRRAGLGLMAGLILLMSCLVSPLLGAWFGRMFARVGYLETRLGVWRTIEWPQREDAHVYLLSTPGTWTGLFLPYENLYFTGRQVGDYIPVSIQSIDFEMTRLDADTVRLRSPEGFLSGYFAQALAALVRPDPRIRPRETFHRAGLTVAVTRSPAGIPTEMIVRFPLDLDDERVHLLAFDGTRTRRIPAPAIGELFQLRIQRP